MKQTQFLFFKNTPLIDFQNTIHFSSEFQRDTFFLEGGHYNVLRLEKDNFNFIRDNSELTVSVDYNDMRGVNYCTFLSEFEPDTRYYAYVLNYDYVQPNVTRITLMIDPIMTYTQGRVLEDLPNLTVHRQHLPRNEYQEKLWELKNNNDIIKTYTKSYFHEEELLFNDLIVVISTSARLQGNFGTVNDPHIQTSRGNRFDNITSPLNLYVVEMENFNRLMGELSDYPWISQNIKSLTLLPKIFMEDNLTTINFTSNDTLNGIDYLFRVTGTHTHWNPLLNEVQEHNKSPQELYELFGFDPENEAHLLRDEYTTTELYNYSGGQLFVDNGKISMTQGLQFLVDMITGHETQIAIYIGGYKVENRFSTSNRIGGYLNDALIFDQFDDIPMFIDNFTLSMAKSANRRELAESRHVTNRIQNVMDPGADLKDRFFDAASLVSNISVSGLFGKFTDEYEYYRNQKAEHADLALETPTITQQSHGNSFNIANNVFGIHWKYSKPSDTEMNKIKKYYKLFGFQIEDQSTMLSNVQSMNICNYLQFSGSWTLPNCDVALIEMMKAQFENGVRFWHDNGTPNPMEQNVLENEMRV